MAPGATARDGVATDRSGKIIPPRKGTRVGTFKEQSGSQLAKIKRVVDVENLLGRHRPTSTTSTRTGWNGNFPGWKEEWDAGYGRVPFVS